MVYLVRFKKNIRGFSLIETIVVVSIFLLFLSIGNSAYNDFRVKNNLEVSVNGYVQALRHAQINSEQVQGDSAWGVAIFSDKVVVFKGQNYINREISSDQIFNFPKGINTGGLSEIVFEKATGWAENVGTTTIINNKGELKNIFINEKGTITY